MTDVVLDTNVWVSSLFWKGPCWHLLGSLNQEGHRIFTSNSLLDELAHVLQRDFDLAEPAVVQTIRKITSGCTIVIPDCSFEVVHSDPSDNKVLECAVYSKAHYIITQDKKHLLRMHEFQGVKIVSPTEFLQWLDVFQK